LGLLAGGLLLASAAAQPPASTASAPQAGEPQGLEEIVVRGRRMSEIEADLRIHVGEFLTEVTAPVVGRGYARWYRRVCISVSNLQRDTAQYLVDRIARLAIEVGLEPGEPGCRPDVIVIFTTDGRGTAQYLVDSDPTLLRPFGDSGVHRGLDALREFVETDRPVRWWHVSMPVDARLGTPAMRVPGEPLNAGATRGVKVAGPSRIHSGIRDELKYAVIIVDGPKLQGQGTTWQQIGDYLAVVALAQIDLDANPAGFDSILNLFTNPAAYSGLTDWDESYVRSLYSYDQERRPSLQTSEIAGRMVTQELDRAN
jgi:hypothetical protein